MIVSKQDKARFMKFVQKTDSCWYWWGAHDGHGYGSFSLGGRSGRMEKAHRVSWWIHVGPIPKGKQLDHVKSRGCDSRDCVNPAHLQPVTQRVNIMRGEGFSAVNARKTHCVRGHEFSDENTYRYRKGKRWVRECRICRKESCRQHYLKSVA